MAAEQDKDSDHHVTGSPLKPEPAGRDALAGLRSPLSNRAVARFLGRDGIALSDSADPLVGTADVTERISNQMRGAGSAGAPLAADLVHALAPSNAAVARLLADGAGPGGSVPAPLADRISRQMRGAGAALPTGHLSDLESGLGVSLDPVRVHIGAESAAAADTLGASAFTVGQHIFLGTTRVPVRSDSAYATLAHEAVHTVQNRGLAAASSLAPGSRTSEPGSDVEVEAAAVAERLAGPRGGAEAGPVPVNHPGSPALAGIWPFDTDTRTTRQRIDEALRSGDPDDVKDIDNVALATVDERLRLLHILVDQWWAGNSDEAKMEQIWASFGPDVRTIAGRDGLALWHACIDKGADLEDLPQVEELRRAFIYDVTRLARDYLVQNRRSVEAEIARYGLAPGAGAPAPPSPEQRQQVMDLQQVAASAAILQHVQEQARATPVGYNMEMLSPPPTANAWTTPPMPIWIPALFDPNRPPDITEAPGFPAVHVESEREVRPYEPIHKAYADVTVTLATILRGYPAIFAVIRQNSAAATERFASMDPTAARAELATGLQAVLTSIRSAWAKLGDDLDPLDLTPLHEQLFSGQRGATGTDWTGVLARHIAQQEVKDHQFNLALQVMGLQLASQALFLLAPFSGGTTAALAVMLGGVAIAGVQWSMSESHYLALADAAGAAATPGTEMVRPEQVAAAEAAHMADTVALALAVLTVGVAAAGAGVVALRARMAAAAQRAALLEQVGQPSTVTTLRSSEVPYGAPKGAVQVARPGKPLDLDKLNPNRRYLWIVDEEGNFKVADEGQADFFPRRQRIGEGEPAAGETPLKHGDLVPGPKGQTRGAARAGGELNAERDPGGGFTGRWKMNAESSYMFARTDEQRLGLPSVEAAMRLLATTGTDVTRIIPVLR